MERVQGNIEIVRSVNKIKERGISEGIPLKVLDILKNNGRFRSSKICI